MLYEYATRSSVPSQFVGAPSPLVLPDSVPGLETIPPTQQHVVRCGQFLSTAFEEIVKGPNNIRKADDPFAEWYPITSTRRICISLRQSNFADRPFAAQDLIPTKRWQSAGSHIFWRTPPRKNIPSCESVVEIREFG